jgi:hypothetical protein
MSEHIEIGDISPRIQYVADGASATFIYPFSIFDDKDLLVYLDDALQSSGYTVSGAGGTAGGAATFDTAPTSGTVVTLTRMVPEERTTDFQEGGAFRAVVINTELDRIVCMVQQLRDELTRSVVRPATSTATASLALPDPVAGKALKWNAAGDGLANSAVDPDTLASAVTDAQAAQASAEAAQGLAESARDAAQGYAAAAASDSASVASALASIGRESVDRVSADTTLTAASNGHIVVVDASAGQVVVTLPVGSAIGEPGSISVQKMDSTTHTVLVRRQGSDTIDGGTSDYELAAQYSGARFAVDIDVDPDDWAALPFGAGAVTQAAFDVLSSDVSDHATRIAALESAVGGGYLHVRDEEPSGTNSMTVAAANTNYTRTLNTVKTNTISGASLASNQITLPAGTYQVRGRALVKNTESAKTLLWNVTDGTVALMGSTVSPERSYGAACDGVVEGRITLTSTKTLALVQRWKDTANGSAQGVAAGVGYAEVYAEVFIEKVA